MKSIVMKAAVGVLKVAYVPFRLLPKRNKITFLSRQSNEPTADIALLSDYMGEKYPDIEICILAKKLSGAGYVFHVVRQLYHIATSKVLVLDSYCIPACCLKHKEGTRVLQMWHASAAIKQFGYQTIGKAEGHSAETAQIMCMHRNYDYVTCPSEATGRLFCQGFNVDSSVLRFLALPVIDTITEPDPQLAADMRREYGLDEEPCEGKETVLYVPTMRRLKDVDIRPLIENFDFDRFNLVVKLHPLNNNIGDRAALDSLVRSAGGHPSQLITGSSHKSFDWIGVCDRIITDYSALGVEGSLAGKPLYYYVYDIDEYLEQAGLNINPLEEMPSCSAVTSEELMQIMKAEYDFDALGRFRDRYFRVPVTECTRRMAEFIAGLTEGRDTCRGGDQ